MESLAGVPGGAGPDGPSPFVQHAVGARRAARLLVLALLAFGCTRADLAGGESGPNPEREPTGWNLVYVVIDTLRADHLGLYGHDSPTSPHLDAFASRAVVFEHAYSAAPWTKPSVASMFTSLFPPQHGVLEEGTQNRLSESLTTLPEVLREAGYRTMAISENPHVQPHTGFEQGFERFDRVRGFAKYKGQAARGVAKAISWLGEPAEAPFFLYLHLLDPHGPYTPSEPHAQHFLGGFPDEVTAGPDRRLAEGQVGVMVDGEELTIKLGGRRLAYLEGLYDTEIREVDDALSEIFAFLSVAGLWEETVVLVTSDHGEEFLDHGSLRHGYRLYDESIRVPLLMAVPNRPAGRSRELAQHVDLAPTLLSALGLAAPDAFQGRDLFGAESDGGGPRSIFSSTSWRGIDRCAVRRGDWKWIAHRDTGEMHLFNMRDDPAEQRDLLADHPDLANELEAAYVNATRTLPGVTPMDASGDVDAGLEAELQAIGYMGDDE